MAYLLEIPGKAPTDLQIIIRKKPGYRTFWHVYIKGHWLYSWWPITVNGSSDKEEILSIFLASRYPTVYKVVNEKLYPEHFI